MNPSRVLTFILISPLLLAPFDASADSMYCENGNLVSSGDTMANVVENCGKPISRRDDQWVYQSQGGLSKIVTFSDGLVVSITDGNFPGFQNTPFENEP
jgi:hypothetical protein